MLIISEVDRVVQPEIALPLVQVQEAPEGVHIPQEMQERADATLPPEVVPEPESVLLPQEMQEHAEAIFPAERVPVEPPIVPFSPVGRVQDEIEVVEAPWAPGNFFFKIQN